MSAIVITGGTGTFGRAFIRAALAETAVDSLFPGELRWQRVISLSRDEVKAEALRQEFGHHRAFKAFLGDVRDRDRLAVAFRGVDTVVHAAALKRVDQGAYSPSEIMQTNITGTMNVVTEAIDAGVRRVVVISSDKAVAPTNIYGATKFCSEVYAVQANNYGHNTGTRIAAVRYGNVLGSRGSVVHIWRKQAEMGQRLTVTDKRMTRFIMTIEDAVALVQHALTHMLGGEVFVPVLPSAYMLSLAEAVARTHNNYRVDQTWWQETGLRPGGEKLAEALLNEEEPTRTRRANGCYMVLPSHHEWTTGEAWAGAGVSVDPDMVYRSDDNVTWIGWKELQEMLARTEAMR